MVDALGYFHTSVFDPVGRLEAVVDPLGHITTTIFDSVGQPIGQVDALGNRTSTVFDAIGRTIARQDARGFLTSFVFDAASEQVAVVDANSHITSNVFDPRGSLLSTQNALGAFTSKTYDAVGNRILRTDARNDVTTYTLDALNRTAGQLYPDSTRVTNTFDAARQQITQQDNTGIRSFSWDLDGRQIGVVDPTGMRLTYTLDSVGNRLLMLDPNAGLTSYSWDAQNRLIGIVNPFAEFTTISYDALNRELKKTLANGMNVSHSYDAAGREIVLGNYSSAGVALAVFTSTFDAANNRLTVLEVNGSRVTYGYDPSYQLTSEQRSSSNAYNTSFQYDPLGNRLVANQSGSITSSSYNAANELVLLAPASGPPTTSSYDANGNLTLENAGGSLTSYSWDFENRLIAVVYPTGQRQTFGYAANGQRTQVTTPSSGLAYDLWDGDNLLLSTSASLVPQAHYTDNPGYWGGLVSQNQSGVSTFYGFDGSGNTRALVSSAEAVLATYLYEAFGLELLSPAASNIYWYNGQFGYQRDWPNRYDVRSRPLEVANGRWISRDPSGYDGGVNFYGYGVNNPLMNTYAPRFDDDNTHLCDPMPGVKPGRPCLPWKVIADPRKGQQPSPSTQQPGPNKNKIIVSTDWNLVVVDQYGNEYKQPGAEIQECARQVPDDPDCQYPDPDPHNWNGRTRKDTQPAPPWAPPYFDDLMFGSTTNGVDLNPRHQYYRIVIKNNKGKITKIIPLLEKGPHLIVSTPTCVQRFFPPWAQVLPHLLQYLGFFSF